MCTSCISRLRNAAVSFRGRHDAAYQVNPALALDQAPFVALQCGTEAGLPIRLDLGHLVMNFAWCGPTDWEQVELSRRIVHAVEQFEHVAQLPAAA